MQHLPILFVPLFLIAGIFLWFVVSTMLRSMSGLEKGIPTPPGTPLKESGWGSAKLNVVNWRNAIKVVEYKDGWLIRAMPIFGGGTLWMPRDSTQIGPLEPGKFFMPPKRSLDSGNHHIRLFGHLAEFVSDI